MTTRDWAHVVLTAVMAYPVVVSVMFVYRALGVSIEPFEDAFVLTGPVLGRGDRRALEAAPGGRPERRHRSGRGGDHARQRQG